MIPDRKQIAQHVIKIAKKTREEIKKELEHATSIYIAFDEWQDSKSRRYIGLTARALINTEYNFYVLALRPLYDIHASSEVYASIIRSILSSYGITSKITGCASDNESIMVLTAQHLGLFRCPCVCHLFNLLFKAFFDELSKNIEFILKLAATLNRSASYSAFCENEKIKKVPTYVEIRWMSACNTILCFNDVKESITTFMESENMQPIPESQWIMLQALEPLAREYTTIIKSYESDSFGALGFFRRDLMLFQNEIHKLQCFPWATNAVKQFDEKLDFPEKKNIQIFLTVLLPLLHYSILPLNFQKFTIKISSQKLKKK